MRFSRQKIHGLRPKDRLYWLDDDALPGFRVGVTPKGVVTYAVRLRKGGRANRQDTTHVIGRHPVLTVEEARGKAREMLSRWALGVDVAAERRASREARTVEQLAHGFIDEWERRRKASTVREYRRLLDMEIVPAFGNIAARDLQRGKVARWHTRLGTRAPVVANRALRLLRTVFSWAETRGEVPEGTSPTKGIDYFPERAKERFLTAEEIARLGETLNRAEREGIPPDPKRAAYAVQRGGKKQTTMRPANPWAIAAIRFLLLSGWREQEVLSLRWDAIDLDNGVVLLSETKGGRSRRPVGDAAVEVLRRLPRVDGSPFVFHGRRPNAPLVEIKHVWHAIRHAAGLADVREHDLRHTFASASMEGGTPLYTTGQLIGHRDVSSTARYAHIGNDPLKRAANITSAALEAQLAGERTPVTPLRAGVRVKGRGVRGRRG
ncbi:MAG: tyrosine-type recombinase/integrase [Gemmatimonadetes bacterium]|nr:tyrosine-type recombinase/integrase [Gemmatimonadota bacterium]